MALREEAACLCQEEPMDRCLLRSVDDEDDDDDDDNHRYKMTLDETLPYEQPAFSLHSCLTSKPLVIVMYLVLFMVLLCSFISLVVISVLVAAPYAKASHFVQTQCSTAETTWLPEEEQCSCGKGCSSRYPCLLVIVNVTFGAQSTKTRLADDESILRQKCSFYPHCHSSRRKNEEALVQYQANWGRVRTTFNCLYNPGNPTEVIRQRRFHLRNVVHGLLWTSVLFLVSSVLLVLVFRWKGLSFA